MGCFLKIIAGLVALLVLIAALVFGSIWYIENQAPQVIVREMTERTGYPTQLESAKLNLIDSYLRIDGLTINNPEGQYVIPAMVNLKTFEVDFDAEDSSREKLVFDRVALDIAELAIVTNDKGENNFQNYYKAIQPEPAEGETTPTEPTEPTPDEPASTTKQDYLIRDFELHLGTVRYRNDASNIPLIGKKDESKDLDYTLKLKDVTDLNSVYAQVVAELKKRGLREVLPYVEGPVQDLLQGTPLEGQNLQEVEGTLRNLFEKRAE